MFYATPIQFSKKGGIHVEENAALQVFWVHEMGSQLTSLPIIIRKFFFYFAIRVKLSGWLFAMAVSVSAGALHPRQSPPSGTVGPLVATNERPIRSPMADPRRPIARPPANN